MLQEHPLRCALVSFMLLLLKYVGTYVKQPTTKVNVFHKLLALKIYAPAIKGDYYIYSEYLLVILIYF